MACTTRDTNDAERACGESATGTDLPTAAPTYAERAGEARGFAVAFDALAAAFLNEPSEQVLGDVRRVAQALGVTTLDEQTAEGCCAGEAGAALRQRYYDRVIVASSPVHVPLLENCVAGSAVDDKGVAHYNAVQGSRGDHVLRCYRALGFDFKALPGYHLLIQTLHCDYIGCELAFLAFMKSGEAQAWEAGDEAQAAHWHELALRFARDHAGSWLPTAAKRLAATDDDVYARMCAFAADVTATLAEEK